MYNSGQVLTQTAFASWAGGIQSKERSDGVLAALPPYAPTYDPTVIPQIGGSLRKVLGISGSPGYYYPPTDPVQP